jgi:hypothetical protein
MDVLEQDAEGNTGTKDEEMAGGGRSMCLILRRFCYLRIYTVDVTMIGEG